MRETGEIAIDVSETAQLRRTMVWGTRFLTLLGSYVFLYGIAGMGRAASKTKPIEHSVIFGYQNYSHYIDYLYIGIGLLYSVFGAVLVRSAFQMRRIDTRGAAQAVSILGLLLPIWLFMFLDDLMTDGIYNNFHHPFCFVLGVLSLVTAAAMLRYNVRIRELGIGKLDLKELQSKYIQNWRDFRVFGAIFLSIGCFVIGIFLHVNYTRADDGEPSIYDYVYGSGKWQTESRIDIISKIGPAVLIIGTPFFWNVARRLATISAAELRTRDRRPAIFYIRSFGDDVIRYSSRRWRLVLLFSSIVLPLLRFFYRDITFEESIVSALSAYGPVTALRQPGQKYRLVGAAREKASDLHWRQTVAENMKRAIAIVAIVGSSPGLSWELDALRRSSSLQKLVLIIPPIDTQQIRDRWERLSNVLPEIKCLTSESIIDSGLIVDLKRRDQPLVVYSSSRAESDYFEALLIKMRDPSGVREEGGETSENLPADGVLI